MRKISLTFAIFCFAAISFAQQKRSSIYVELGGNTALYSVNYDHVFTISKKLRIAPRLGFMYLPIEKFVRTDFGNIRIPIELNLLWSNKDTPKHFLEGGLGISFIQIQTRTMDPQSGTIKDGNRFGNVTTLRFGYRYQKSTGGLMFRAGLLVPIGQDDFSRDIMGDDIFFTVFPGLSLGYSF